MIPNQVTDDTNPELQDFAHQLFAGDCAFIEVNDDQVFKIRDFPTVGKGYFLYSRSKAHVIVYRQYNCLTRPTLS